MNSFYKTLLGYLVLIAVMVQIGCAFAEQLKRDHELYLQESACVREYIQIGIERRDIATGNGTCWVEDNGYYNTRGKQQ